MVVPAPPGRNLGVLVSGRGSNLAAILAAIRSGALNARIGLVLSNRRKAGALEIAREAGLPTAVLSHRRFPERAAYDRALLARLRGHGVDLVCLAGFMRILSPLVVDAYRHRIVNIHPSLLPAFPGLHPHRQALEYGVRLAGCTVHLVDEELDHGPILMQEAVPVNHDDTEDSLAARVLAAEHRLFPRAIATVLDGGLRLDGRRVLPRESRSRDSS